MENKSVILTSPSVLFSFDKNRRVKFQIIFRSRPEHCK